ncbi:LPXTG-motif cell wall anchor domain-containing protein, partial [Atopostipes suicloacalis DSM 15692]
EATQEEVQSALRDLRLAEITLEKVEEPEEVDKNELAEAVALAKKRNEANYTDESWKSFVTALKEAEKTLADETATQKDIQKSLNNLLATENNLVEKVTMDEEKDESQEGSGNENSGSDSLPLDKEVEDDTKNSINGENEGTLPKTGENSSLFITIVGLVSLIIGGLVFRKRKSID